MVRANLYETFIDSVNEIGQDKYVKKLTTLAYFKLFLHAELQGRDGLRDIANDVLCRDIQREFGLPSISAAQLSRKHNQADPALLSYKAWNLRFLFPLAAWPSFSWSC
ncbi:hypothetical protein FHS14_001329 [Paenibacillus baekrokdamisoli]|uniref:DUF4372 domain-containing protein n=1 Tax=Paenibacillus baekrokdamisoli TaxID=1712516 RepID=UPI000F79C0D0|nr:DUF4372 domain-containing protein [Paenibacillus baekrokdamisoli]MBB3068353.1 hypothetical protein [Paenibacillus baekrokdamisoli]